MAFNLGRDVSDNQIYDVSNGVDCSSLEGKTIKVVVGAPESKGYEGSFPISLDFFEIFVLWGFNQAG